MRIADREIGPGHSTFIVAEISGNHNGNYDRALTLIRTAWATGADAVKFQAFTVEEILMLRGEGQALAPWERFTNRQLYERIITPGTWLPALFQKARAFGLVPFASVFGLKSLALLESVGCPAYKIAKSEAGCRWLIDAAQATGKPVLISGKTVHCPGGYPCHHHELDLARLRELPALSCHCPDPWVGALAVACGAHYLEFHLTLDDGIETLDDPVNLPAPAFADMVAWVRRAEIMLWAA